MSETSADGRIITEKRGRVFIIKLDRAKKLNGFSVKMIKELAAAYTAFEQDDDAWVGLLCAEGPHFTAGLQLDQIGPYMARGESLWPDGVIDPFGLRDPKRSKPMVTAVQGITYTIGIEFVAGEQIVHRIAPAGALGHANRCTAGGHDAAFDFELRKPAVVRGYHDVGRQHQLDADGVGDALHCRHHRLAAFRVAQAERVDRAIRP